MFLLPNNTVHGTKSIEENSHSTVPRVGIIKFIHSLIKYSHILHTFSILACLVISIKIIDDKESLFSFHKIFLLNKYLRMISFSTFTKPGYS